MEAKSRKPGFCRLRNLCLFCAISLISVAIWVFDEDGVGKTVLLAVCVALLLLLALLSLAQLQPFKDILSLGGDTIDFDSEEEGEEEEQGLVHESSSEDETEVVISRLSQCSPRASHGTGGPVAPLRLPN